MKPQPCFKSYPNPLHRGDQTYSHYEIQSIRQFTDPHGETYMEICLYEDDCSDDANEASGPVVYGIYGRLAEEEAEHIGDFETLAAAENTLTKMGVRR